MLKALWLGMLLVASVGYAQPKQVLNVLFVGKTQTGKSSLINIFYNHIIGKKYEDERAVVIPLRDGADDLPVNVDPYQYYGVVLQPFGKSQTQQVLRYTASNEKYVVHLWDAPGFNDTNEEVSDEEIVGRIANAIGETSFDAVFVVLKPNEPASFDMKANIARVSTMLPKTAARNLVGIYTRAAYVSAGTRKAGAEAFTRLLGRSPNEPLSNTYFIDGGSFFDKSEPTGASRWLEDAAVVRRVIDDVANFGPFDALAVSEIQNLTRLMQAKFEEHADKLVQSERAIGELSRIAEEENAAQIQAQENLLFNKKVKVRFETNIAVHCRALGFLWSYSCGTQKQTSYRDEWITDAAQRDRFFAAHRKLSQLQEEKHDWQTQLASLRRSTDHLLAELRDLKVQWKHLALASDVDAFIAYLEHQLRGQKRQSNCRDGSCEDRVLILESRKNFYSFIRDL